MPDSDELGGAIRVGTVLKNKWRIDERIGSGGMATVYAATHRNGSRVAIKVLTKAYSRDPTARERFLREGYAANAVGHPGIVKVLDDDETQGGEAFLVMELLEGESLEALRVRLGGRLGLAQAVWVGEQVLDLLAAAHAKGIVHRDIKPDNVFLTNDGHVKLLDFGVAQMRGFGGNLTGAGLMLGTPDFMSPEQAGGHPSEIDGRSDLWAIGAMLFFLLSGETVHVSETLRDHIIATATRPARALAAVAPEAPTQLAAVIDRALRLDKNERWPDARAMREALRAAQRETTRARPVKVGDDVDDSEPTQFQRMRFSEPPSAAEERTIALASTASLEGGGPASARRAAPQGQPPGAPVLQVRTERMLHVDRIVAAAAARAAQGAPPPPSGPHAAAPPKYSPPTLQGHSADPRQPSIARRRLDRVLVVALLVLAPLAAGVAGWMVSGSMRNASAPPAASETGGSLEPSFVSVPTATRPKAVDEKKDGAP
jgi:eukaryotic-like serine/threonine-protein kinase